MSSTASWKPSSRSSWAKTLLIRPSRAGHWLNDGPYGTLHRLASAGHRSGVGRLVIDWCLEHCESLRADTHADNKVMQHVLESNGFSRCGIIHLANGSPRIAYQKLGIRQLGSE